MEKVVFLGDLHAPYHDERAWKLFLRAMTGWKPQHIFVVGDFCDFYSVSAHDKSPSRMLRLQEELLVSNGMLDELDELGAKYKVFVAGNHEDRMQRYINTKAPELDGMVTVQGLLQLRDRGWEFVPYRDYTSIGKVYVTHDVGVAGRYSTFKAMEVFEHSVVTGHSHRFAQVVEGNAVGEAKVSCTFGWLGDINKVDYMHRIRMARDWALGFGIGRYDPKTGYVYLSGVPLVNYSVNIEGTRYVG